VNSRPFKFPPVDPILPMGCEPPELPFSHCEMEASLPGRDFSLLVYWIGKVPARASLLLFPVSQRMYSTGHAVVLDRVWREGGERSSAIVTEFLGSSQGQPSAPLSASPLLGASVFLKRTPQSSLHSAAMASTTPNI
jgi:hypothetical protein